ncbi:MAG: hypothetical protein PHC66_04535 [Candidatus Nanoarchaeia archaeon]|nr:hypothetical protein [Candidatus Nanoarchaeia archaeon]MDD5239774.1 hypothetical protein [Candidatus Nanoarchaeia archaeon]
MSFTIVEPKLGGLINLIDEASQDSRVPYVIVGGTASQLNIANALYKDYGLTLEDLSKKVTPYFRPTDDIDMASKILDGREGIKDFRNTLIEISNRGYEVSFRAEKSDNCFSGKLRYAKGQNGEARINFNIEKATGFSKDYYNQIVKRSHEIDIPYKGKQRVTANVIDINDLIVTKLDGLVAGRQKDAQDLIYNLVFNEPRINEGYVLNTIRTHFSSRQDVLLSKYNEMKILAKDGKEAILNLIK